jgi:hypothetical protein
MKCLIIFLAVLLTRGGSLLAQNAAPGNGDLAKDPKSVTVTGCLTRSPDAKGNRQYSVKAGEMSYPLERGAEKDLKAHIGHKVTITGTSMKGQGPHDEDRIHITQLTMVSASCP